jgi:multicomponent Na+:H+ antiporter subunit F
MVGVVTVVQIMLGLGAVLALVRAVRGPDLVDRIVALDLVLLLLAGGLAAHGARSGSQFYIAVLVVVALVAFAGTVLVARFIEWRDAS